MNNGLLLIISGPSGTGKGTVINELKKDSDIAVSISYTTRPKRVTEIEDVSYFFTGEARFRQMVKDEMMLEHAVFDGYNYGTPKDYVFQMMNVGKTVILEIDIAGALQVKDNFSEAVLVFLMPPNPEELKRRLVSRGTNSRDSIETRLKIASYEIKNADLYDYIVINDNIYKAVSDINFIIRCESALRPKKARFITELFKGDY